MKKTFWQRKTVYASLALMVTPFLEGIADAFGITIEPTMVEGVQAILAGLALIFAREAIENSKP